jgi:pimeloyl-ACP methyl ester carboxylesterase
MRIDSNNPWLSQPSHSALVSLSTHSLHASISGPIRLPNAPLLIFFTGGGACCAIYVELQHLLSQHYRVLFYDRAGNDQSTLPPPRPNGDDKIYAQDIAQELIQFLSITQLEPPYIPIGHSYGGIPARCFFSLNPSAVTGMVLLDTATELTLAMFPRIPPPELESLIKNLDWEAVTHFREDSNMTDEEFEYAMGAQERCVEATKRQDTHTSAHRLAQEHQIDNQALGSRPLSVMRFNATHDYQVLYDAAIERGDGTEEERRAASVFLEKFGLYHEQIIRAQCRLSSDVSYKYIGEWGHDVPCRKPEVLLDEIRNLVERAKKKGETLDGC